MNKLLSFIVAALVLVFGYGFLERSAFFLDAENRWQRYYYDFQQSLPKSPIQTPTPIYLVELDDQSLPEGTCRSPINKSWLNNVLQSISKQSPRAVGLNLLVEDGDTPQDRKLRETIKNLNNVVLLDSMIKPGSHRLKKAAKSWGIMSYRTNSAGDVQYVCNDPALCACYSRIECKDQRIFFQELTTLMGSARAQTSSRDGWLKLFFRFSPDHVRQTIGKKPWQILSADQVTDLPPKSLQPGSLILVGPSFKGLYPGYRVSNQQLAASAVEVQHRPVSDLELTALVMDMILSNSGLDEVPFWMEILLLFGCFFLVAVIAWRKNSFAPIWLAIVLSISWNLSAALLFSYFQLEVSSLLPSLAIIIFSFYCLRYQQVETKFEKLALENQLEKERFNGLVDRFHSHSVFNALEHIRYLVRIKAPEVETYILDYSTLLLDDLRHYPQQDYPLKEQWDYINNYLNLQNLKLHGRITIEFHVDANANPHWQVAMLPWKLFYPLVENAFKQTKAYLDSVEEISPRIYTELIVEEKKLQFNIKNSFYKETQPAGTGQGLTNLNKRLSILYPKGGWQLVHSTEEDDWISSMTLPLESK